MENNWTARLPPNQKDEESEQKLSHPEFDDNYRFVMDEDCGWTRSTNRKKSIAVVPQRMYANMHESDRGNARDFVMVHVKRVVFSFKVEALDFQPPIKESICLSQTTFCCHSLR
ncbi:hypothetical protein Bca101_069510 [Brassica carinata]